MRIVKSLLCLLLMVLLQSCGTVEGIGNDLVDGSRAGREMIRAYGEM